MNTRLKDVGNWMELARQSGYNARILAGLCGISTRQLRRLASDFFRQSPQQWLNEQRLILAAEMLLKDCDSIKLLAGELGYKDGSHFCHQFKRRYGLAPKEFIIYKMQQDSPAA